MARRRKIISTLFVLFIAISGYLPNVRGASLVQDYNQLPDDQKAIEHQAKKRETKKDVHPNYIMLDDINKRLEEIRSDLESMMKDLEAIKAEQKPIEDGTRQNYPEPNVIQKQIEELIPECKKLVADTKDIAAELGGIRKGPPQDVGVSMHPPAKLIIKLNKGFLALAEKIEILGQKFLKNWEGLQAKEKVTQELKLKYDTQAKHLEGVGGKLKNIGKNFLGIAEHLAALGNELEGFDGTKMKKYAEELKDLGKNVTGKGGTAEEIGTKIQKQAPVGNAPTPKPTVPTTTSLSPPLQPTGPKTEKNEFLSEVNTRPSKLTTTTPRPTIPTTKQFVPDTDKEVDEILKALLEISADLEAIIKDLEVIKNEQKFIEADAEKDYVEKDVIPKEVDDLIQESQKLENNAKDIRNQLEQERTGPFKNASHGIVDLNKRILVLANRLEKLGQRILANGEDLKDKEKFTPELKPKFDNQGKRLENIGTKLKNIGKNFGVIGDKLESVGTKVGGDEGPRLKDFAKDLKELGQKVNAKGSAVEELGIKIQKLEPNTKDPALDKDLEDMIKALLEIGNELDGIIKDLEVVKDEQKAFEADTGKDTNELNVYKEVESLQNECKKLVALTKDIQTEIEPVRSETSSGVGKALKSIGGKIVDLEKKILIVSENLERFGQKLLKNRETLRDMEIFTPELKPKSDKQGKMLESIGGRLKSVGKHFGVLGDKMESIVNKVHKDYSPKLKDYAIQLKELGEKVKAKGGSVEELGLKIQKLEPYVKDTGLDKDLEEMIKPLEDIANDLESIMKDLDGIKNEQKAIESDLGNNFTEPNVIPNRIDDMLKDCSKMINDTKEIRNDVEKAREGPNKDVRKAMRSITDKICDLDKRILVLAEKIEKLAQKKLKNGEDLQDGEKFTPELKTRFDRQGKLLEDIGAKLKPIGRIIGVLADKIESVGNRKSVGDNGPGLKEIAKKIKELGEKVKVKGDAIEKLGVRIQKLEPNVRDDALDKDLEDIQKALDNIAHDLESILKDIDTIRKEQRAVEADAGKHYKEQDTLLKKLDELYNECKLLIETAKDIGNDLEKARAAQSKHICKGMPPIGDKILQLGTKILALAEKLELGAQSMLKNGEQLRDKEQFPPELKLKTDKQGKRFENIADLLENIGKNSTLIGSKIELVCSSGDEGVKLKDSGEKIKVFGEKIYGKAGPIEDLGKQLQKLEPNVRDNLTDKDIEDMQKLLNDIGLNLEDIMKDLKVINETQISVEADSAPDYPEPDTVSKNILEANDTCKKLAEACQAIAKELDAVKAGPSKEIAEALHPIGERFVHLAGSLLNLTEGLETLGQKIFKHAEHLQSEKRFSSELKAKTDTQGRNLESIGGKLGTIGKNVCLVASKFGSIAGRVSGENSTKLKEIESELKSTCEQIKKKGEAVVEDGIKLQRLEPKEYNNFKPNESEIASILKAIQSILDLLSEIQKDVKDLKSIQDKQAADPNYNCPTKDKITKLLNSLSKNCTDLVNSTNEITKELSNFKNNPPKDICRPMETIGNEVMHLAGDINKLGENLYTAGKMIYDCALLLREKCMLPPILKDRLDAQGLILECIGGKLELIADHLNITGQNYKTIGANIGDEGGSKLTHQGENKINISTDIRNKGGVINELGADMQNIKPNEGDMKNHKANKEDMTVMHRDLTEIANELENVMRILELLKKEQKRLEANKELEYPEIDVIPKEINSMREECLNLANDTRSIVKDLDKVMCTPPCNIGIPLAEIGDGVVPLASKILGLGDRIGELGDSILANAEILVAADKFTTEVQRKLHNQGKKCENAGDKLGRIGEKFESVGGKITRIAGRPGTENNLEMEDSGGEIKNLGGRIEEKGGRVEEVCIQIQKLESNQTNSESDKACRGDMMAIGRNFGDMEKDLEIIVKELGDVNIEQKAIESDLQHRYPGKGKIPKEIDSMSKECRSLVGEAATLKKDLEKDKVEGMSGIKEPLLRVADRVTEFGNRVMPLAGQLEDLGEMMLKNAEEIQIDKKLSEKNKGRLETQGKDLRDIAARLDDLGEKVRNSGGKLHTIGDRLNEPRLKEVDSELDSLVDRIKEKAEADKESGVELQNLQASMPDEAVVEREKNRDIEVVLKGMEDIARFFGEMGLRLKDAEEDFEDMEGCEGRHPVKREAVDKVEGLKRETDRLEKQAVALEKELGRIKNGSGGKKKERQMEGLANKLLGLTNHTFELAAKLERVGGNMERNGEGLRDEGKCECVDKYRRNGERWEGLGGFLEEIGMRIKGFGDKGNGILGDDGDESSGLVGNLKKFGGRIRSKGNEVIAFGKSLQSLECVQGEGGGGNRYIRADIESCGEGLRFSWEDLKKEVEMGLWEAVVLGNMEKDFEGGMMVGSVMGGEDLGNLKVWLSELDKDGNGLESDVKGIGGQGRGSKCEMVKGRILDLCEFFRNLGDMLEKMGKRVLKKGEGIKETEGLTVEWQSIFGGMGRKIASLGIKMEKVGENLKERDLGENNKLCGDKAREKGGIVKELGMLIEKLQGKNEEDRNIFKAVINKNGKHGNRWTKEDKEIDGHWKPKEIVMNEISGRKPEVRKGFFPIGMLKDKQSSKHVGKLKSFLNVSKLR